MRVKFLKTDTPYERGKEYDLREKEARKFIQQEVAESVSASRPTARTRKKTTRARGRAK